MATTYSWTERGSPITAIPQRSVQLWVWKALSRCVAPLFLCAAFVKTATAVEAPTTVGFNHTNYFETAYREARARFLLDTNHIESAWQFARRCFDHAEFATRDEQRAAIAREGIAAARRALALNTNSAEGHYFLAMNLGQLARTRLLGALKLVDEMEIEFKAAIVLDPKIIYAGPHRSLGTLYREAPGWPASVGDRAKARLHLEKAVEVIPYYPDNLLTLLESYLDWGERKVAEDQLEKTERVMTQARSRFTGPEWILAWQDWEKRWRKLKARLSQ